MLRFLISRLLSALLVVLGVVGLVFLLIHLIPGDPVEVMLGESARVADKQALREALGLNQPLLMQAADYFLGLLRGDLGASLHSKQPVTEILLQRLPATAQLALSALLVACLVALPAGIVSATRRGSAWDHGAMAFSMLGVSIPNFWMGPMLILVFSLWLGWFPISGQAGPASLVLPAVTLGTAMAAILSRMVRSALLEILQEDYIRTARAKGLADYQVLTRHALRNAALPIITILGLQLGVLLGGAVITEVIFSWPGIGQLTIESIQRRDYPLVQGCILLISLSYVLVNTGTDLLYAWIDPRVRLAQK